MARSAVIAMWFGCCLAVACEGPVVDEVAEGPTQRLAATEARLASAREDERLADEVELALAQRWPSLAAMLDELPPPLVSLHDVMRERGTTDLEETFPTGAFSTPSSHRRYFAAMLLGWSSEQAALSVAARLEAQRMRSFDAARSELPDVDQRHALDQLARASSARLQAFCRRLSTLGATCSPELIEAGTPPLADGPNS